MKIEDISTPALTDASAKTHTKKTLEQWFKHLDGAGGVAKGRRELVNHLYSDQKLDEWWSTTIVVEYERARGVKEKDGKPKGYSICATKTITASVEDVFAAWSNVKAVDRWFGPKAKVDFKDGGRIENGSGDRITITRIRPAKDLRFVWQHATRAPESQVEVLFADKGKGKCGVTLNHTRIQFRKDADELRAGWGTALDALKSSLEGSR